MKSWLIMKHISKQKMAIIGRTQQKIKATQKCQDWPVPHKDEKLGGSQVLRG